MLNRRGKAFLKLVVVCSNNRYSVTLINSRDIPRQEKKKKKLARMITKIGRIDLGIPE